jgi:hypothetical protein
MFLRSLGTFLRDLVPLKDEIEHSGRKILTAIE